MPTKGVHWTVSGNFAPIDEVLDEAIAEENYEYACILRDAL
jgi:protein-arginine kinase activator protein McsA